MRFLWEYAVCKDIVIEDLYSMDLSGFDIEMTCDNSRLNFSGYLLTGELGDVDAGDAEDSSYSDSVFVPGTVTLSVTSYLNNASLADQADDFVLATLYSWGDEAALAEESVSALNFTAVNIEGALISFSLANAARVSAVPAPAAISLLALGIVSLIPFARRRSA